ncbi:DUF2274 domain-containing protein [Bradyrhizobium japonicum]|uniref:DUF2274 domain-containing protein n=1 Tax=Bradyrhizobium quebecense TaxID=2748629 RepID=A0A973WPB1_9BRAD|nr:MULTISPECIES: DUF2274 domain-containing protein [Bradyrhizobium]MBR1177102.1 DUF2274 domain-containing protein [Bradyrhizobium sp. KB893862 SZCCT0404]UGA47759.1 DUF2274 domain-containing protein [Bradyrhizobium quebecense]UQD76184.1 DUF2274 domain-containing protein [Bradyrhizobium japonicum]
MKLAKLPDRTPVKVNVVFTPGLAQRLREYAAFYAETYGNKEEVAELIPFMLEAFIDGDVAFRRAKQRSSNRDQMFTDGDDSTSS